MHLRSEKWLVLLLFSLIGEGSVYPELTLHNAPHSPKALLTEQALADKKIQPHQIHWRRDVVPQTDQADILAFGDCCGYTFGSSLIVSNLQTLLYEKKIWCIKMRKSDVSTREGSEKRTHERTSSSLEQWNVERTMVQEHETKLSSLDKEIHQDLKEFDSFLEKEEVQEIKDAIKTARQGLELFKDSYKNGSETWKRLLTSDKGAITIQATYLELKPKSHTSCESVGEEEFGEELEQYAGDSVGMTSSAGLIPTIHNENSIKKLFNNPRYADIFDDYDSTESEPWEYLQKRDDSFIQYRNGGNWTQEQGSKYMIGEGFLFGYAEDSVRGYPTYKHAESLFGSKDVHLTMKQKALREGFFWGKPVYELYMSEGFDESLPGGKIALKVAKSRFTRDDRRQFIDDYQREIQSLLKENFPEIGDDGRDALIAYRGREFFGQYHLVDSRSKRDEYHYAKQEYIFRRSGMPEYLASLNH